MYNKLIEQTASKLEENLEGTDISNLLDIDAENPIKLMIVGGYALEILSRKYGSKQVNLDRDTPDIDFYCPDALMIGALAKDFNASAEATGISAQLNKGKHVEIFNVLELPHIEDIIVDDIFANEDNLMYTSNKSNVQIYAPTVPVWVAVKTNSYDPHTRVKDGRDVRRLMRVLGREQTEEVEALLDSVGLIDKYNQILDS